MEQTENNTFISVLMTLELCCLLFIQFRNSVPEISNENSLNDRHYGVQQVYFVLNA